MCSAPPLSTAELQEKLLIHLGDLSVEDSGDRPWRLDDSALGGRGMFATRDIAVNETIFRDRTLVIGPRAAKFEFPTCVMCHKRLSLQDVCKNGCGLSVCPVEQCQQHPGHRDECEMIVSWGVKNQSEVSMNLLRSLTAIRGLLLTGNAKQVLDALQPNPCAQIVAEVERTVAELTDFPEELKKTLYHICSVLNTNAFETKLSNELHSEDDSLRGEFLLFI